MWTLAGVILGIAFMVASALATLAAATTAIVICAIVIGRRTSSPS